MNKVHTSSSRNDIDVIITVKGSVSGSTITQPEELYWCPCPIQKWLKGQFSLSGDLSMPAIMLKYITYVHFKHIQHTYRERDTEEM